ncbi:MAG: monofunctional biosynthetic peptidoglycan transglycosylase [Bacteroidetes bacterium GWA2_30_7]|nr:MAG: monofunctional biosynthetic peptidoglycan transglycosylase [Bacteroidetes bacterium GWA2_30_7]
MKKSKSGFFKRIFKLLIKSIIIFLVLSVLSTLFFRFVPIPFTPLMIIRLAQQTFGDKDVTFKKDWVSIDEMSKNVVIAAIAAEDQKFPEHWGFDIESIEKAMKNNQKKKRIKGASTISQQTAKNVFLWPHRDWIRKGFEVYFTFLIETIWSKERIIEVYLNVAELGNGVYGIEAASQKYFKKSALKLSKSEAALIVASLPNPIKFNPSKPSNYMLGRQQWILRQMNNIEPCIDLK